MPPGYACEVYGFYHIQNSSRLDQNIGVNNHKFSLLVNGNTTECNVSQEKKELIKKLSKRAL